MQVGLTVAVDVDVEQSLRTLCVQLGVEVASHRLHQRVNRFRDNDLCLCGQVEREFLLRRSHCGYGDIIVGHQERIVCIVIVLYGGDPSDAEVEV